MPDTVYTVPRGMGVVLRFHLLPLLPVSTCLTLAVRVNTGDHQVGGYTEGVLGTGSSPLDTVRELG